MLDKIRGVTFELILALTVGIAILGMLFIFLPISSIGVDGAIYRVNLGNVSSEQCSYASSSIRDIKFTGITTEIDPCTLNTTYLYNYQVTWKTNAEEWLLVHLGKDRIAPISIQTGEREKDFW
jgi:hypothetical protein